MKRILGVLFLLTLLSGLSGWAGAQQVRRVVLLPFNAEGLVQPYALGLPAALQRALNGVDGLFAPPIGDPALVAQKAFTADLDAVEVLTELFEADALVSGRVEGVPGALTVTVTLAGGSFGEGTAFSVDVAAEAPAAVVREVAAALLPALGLSLRADDQRDFDRALAQTPSLPSLAAAGASSSRLPGNVLPDLEAAAGTDNNSSWVQAELARALVLAGRSDEAATASARAVELLPSDVEAWVARGVVLLASNDREGARAAFEQALTLNPSHALALAGRGRLADGDAARADFTAAIDSYPRLIDAHLGLAALQATDQRALQVLRSAARYLPESVTLHRAFLRRAVALGDARGSLAYLREVLANPLAVSSGLYALAAELPADVAEQALELVTEGRNAFPDAEELAIAHARILRQLGRPAEAEAVLAPFYEQRPDSARLANELALALAEQGRTDDARDVLSSVTDSSAASQINLAQLYLEAGQARAALATLEPLLAQDSNDAELYALYGIALGRTGRYQEATAALDRALELDPELALAQRAKAFLEQQRQVTGDAAITFEGEVATAFEQGLTALELERFAEAAAAFSQARALSDHPLLAFYQAYALQLSGHVREALSGYQQAAEAFPDSDVVLNNLGYTQLQLGRYDLALENLQRAVAANPNNPRAHLNLGLTYYGLKRYAEALEQWQQAIDLDPSIEAAIASLQEEARKRSQP